MTSTGPCDLISRENFCLAQVFCRDFLRASRIGDACLQACHWHLVHQRLEHILFDFHIDYSTFCTNAVGCLVSLGTVLMECMEAQHL